MINYDFGDIVLVDFPFSGTRQRKKRPALVILDVKDRDVVLAPITSAKRSGVGDYKLKDWSANGLLKTSWVRLAKIASLEKGDITRRMGHCTDYDKQKISTLWQNIYRLFPKI
jgi:mRNA interferase MazF